MSLDQLKAFLRRMQDDPALRQAVQAAAATAADVPQLGASLGYEFSGCPASTPLAVALPQ